jgi:hypothetical protein
MDLSGVSTLKQYSRARLWDGNLPRRTSLYASAVLSYAKAYRHTEVPTPDESGRLNDETKRGVEITPLLFFVLSHSKRLKIYRIY